MRAAIATLILLLAVGGGALAQGEPENQRFCLVPSGGGDPAPEQCKFASRNDCEAQKKSEAEQCVPNPALTFPRAEDKPGLPAAER